MIKIDDCFRQCVTADAFAISYAVSGHTYKGKDDDDIVRHQLTYKDNIFKYQLSRCRLGKTRVPCLTNRCGIVLQERRSAETLWAEGMYRTDGFNMNLYLRCSMADTNVHTKGLRERRRVSQAKMLVLSE